MNDCQDAARHSTEPGLQASFSNISYAFCLQKALRIFRTLMITQVYGYVIVTS
jgi:hypothetical protein